MTTAWERAHRPKPPRIRDNDLQHLYRLRLFFFAPSSVRPLRVYRIGGPISPDEAQYFWKVVDVYGTTLDIAGTHAEAIAYAQAQARKEW